MTNEQELIELQRVADYRTVRKTVRASGWGSVLFGVIGIAIGASGLSESPLNAILLLIGAALVVTGLVNIARPTPAGIIVDGCCLLAVGAWNIFITIMSAAAERAGSSSSSSHWAVIGVFQILYGFASFSRYKRFANAYSHVPSANTLQQVDEMLKAIWKSKARESQDIVEFNTQGGRTNMVWKGRLTGDMGVFVMAGGQDVVVASKQQVEIDTSGKVLIGKALKATFQIGDRKLKGTISPESFERFTMWKTGTYVPQLVRS